MEIDRISFVADFAKHIRVKKDGVFDYNDYLPIQCSQARRTFSKWPYRYQIVTDDGFTIFLADRQAPVPPIRFDFNPQTTEYKRWLESFAGSLVNVRVTRLDYAQDYDFDLSGVHFQLETAVKSCQFRSRSNKLETLYLGAQQSPLRFRIYNKGLEQKEDTVRWRIEAQLRFKPADDWWYAMPFEKFVMTRPTWDGLKIAERAMLSYLHENPNGWSELSRNSAVKYKKIMKEQGQAPDFIHPHSIYQKQCVKLKKYVLEILNLTSYRPIDY